MDSENTNVDWHDVISFIKKKLQNIEKEEEKIQERKEQFEVR